MTDLGKLIVSLGKQKKSESTFVFLEDHGSIVAAKAKSVAQCSPHFSLLRLVERKVQFLVEGRIVSEMIDGWRNDVLPDSHE